MLSVAKAIPLLLLAASSTGCGGGSASPSPESNPPASSLPAPTLSLDPISQKVRAGNAFTIALTSANATSCAEVSLGGLSVNGNLTATATAGGIHTYTVTCSSAAGEITRTATVVVPMPVLPTSYDNKMVDIAPAVLPLVTAGDGEVQQASARGYADFEQRGRYNWFIMPAAWRLDDPWLKSPIYIFSLDTDGSWTDVSDALIEPDPLTQTRPETCMMVRKSLVADFNGDGVPDVFMACATDAIPDAPHADRFEMPQMLLSQPSGKLRLETITLKRPIFAHSATAGDVNGDLYPDVVLIDDGAPLGEPRVFVLYNNGNGTFTEDYTQFLTATNGTLPWSTELVTIDGTLVLWLAGNDFDNYHDAGLTQALYGITANGKFNANPTMVLPTVPGNFDMCMSCFAVPLDLVVKDSVAYVLRTNPSYDGHVIQRVDLATNTATVIFEYTGPDFGALAATNPDCRGSGGKWLDFLRAYDGRLVTDYSCTSPNVTMN